MKWVLPVVLALMIFGAVSTPDSAIAQSSNIKIIPELIGPGTEVTVLIADGGLDANPNRIDEYDAEDVELVTFTTDRNEVGKAVPDLEETGENTGIFEFTIQLMTDEESCDNDRFIDPSFEAKGGSEPSIGVCPGDVLSIEYEDSYAPGGGEAVFSSSVKIRSWDPEFVADKNSYNPGDRFVINITDPDANRDPDIADSIRDIRVYSASDPAGEEFSALETSDNTGVFTLAFTTSIQAQGNAILLKHGDDIGVEYTDEFPADFATTTTEKTFIYILIIEFPLNNLSLSTPEIITNGTPVAGKQAMLSTVITNNSDQLRSFVGLLEVRESDGVTVFLAWQSGILYPNSQTKIGVSWTPDRPGDYEVRTFAVSHLDLNLGSPHVLSEVEMLEFTVE